MTKEVLYNSIIHIKKSVNIISESSKNDYKIDLIYKCSLNKTFIIIKAETCTGTKIPVFFGKLRYLGSQITITIPIFFKAQIPVF